MSGRTPATKTERRYRCDDCLPLWDRTGNVKGIQLCDLHATAQEMLELLRVAYVQADTDSPLERRIKALLNRIDAKQEALCQ